MTFYLLPMRQRLTDPQAIRSLLKKYGLWAKKRFGQNFLADENVLRAIVEAADIQPEAIILEIGPGLGVLTRELLPRAKKVIAIEIDRDILPALRETTHFFRDRLELRNEHFLNTILPEVPYQVVSNIPYHLTSPIIRKLLVEAGHRPTSLTLLVQKEVAEQICNTKKSSLLSLFVAVFGEAKIIASVPSSSFSPPPKVDSAILHINVFETPLLIRQPVQKVFSTAKQGFSQKRKKLKNLFPESLLRATEVDPDARAETLSVFDWERLTENIRKESS
ncbi:ribosomal RNA small subunit methyltransferase A [Candidatus Peregrinibacteria bacterium]|nr:MAG: ribosomal RNA small subunit methyltransferase A [Candidatus Peregrinibacteria bacterium]